MWIFGRSYWDFGSYHPDFPAPLDLYIERIPRNDAYIAELSVRVVDFLAEVDAMCMELRARK